MIKPIGSRVTIQSLEIAETKSASGLILPSSNNAQKLITGEVLVCGEKASEVKEGDVVVFNKHSGSEIEAFGESYIIIEEKDIIAIIKS